MAGATIDAQQGTEYMYNHTRFITAICVWTVSRTILQKN